MSRCSVSAEAESLGGTAPFVAGWLIVEQPGPWGRDAVTDSRLPDPVRQTLMDLKRDGWGVLLSRVATRRSPRERNVWVAMPKSPLRHGIVDSIGEVARLDFTSLPFGEPEVFVCTHSGRDECCAVLGRPLATASGAWECSHIGGHRFAPVLLDLPSGNVFGRLDDDDITAIRRGAVPLQRLRGCSFEPAPVQVIRQSVSQVTAIDEISIDETSAEFIVSTDGNRYRARLERQQTDLVRQESCGADPTPVHTWVVVKLDSI